MSADWFCKIGDKKYGPLNDKQIKTIVAKGQLKPEHLVRQGSEGPWVPAGRVKGLFPAGAAGNAPSQGKKPPSATAKPLPKAATKPGTPPAAKATNLPTAAAAPAPPAADIPQELSLGGHHKHVQMNVDSLDIDALPVNVSRRKVKSGMKGLKKSEQKKLTILLWCFIGGGMTIGLIAVIWTIASSNSKPPDAKTSGSASPASSAAPAPAADSGKKTEKERDTTDKKPAKEKEKDKEPETWNKIKAPVVVGNVEVMVLKPTRGAPPQGATTKETDVLIVPVRLNLKEGATKKVELASWLDESFQKKVSLKDDQKGSYDLLDQVPADKDSDGKSITKKWMRVYLVFEAPTDKKVKSLRLKLPAAAFQPEGPILGFQIYSSDIEPAKSTEADKPEKATKSGEGDSEEAAAKNEKK